MLLSEETPNYHKKNKKYFIRSTHAKYIILKHSLLPIELTKITINSTALFYFPKLLRRTQNNCSSSDCLIRYEMQEASFVK